MEVYLASDLLVIGINLTAYPPTKKRKPKSEIVNAAIPAFWVFFAMVATRKIITWNNQTPDNNGDFSAKNLSMLSICLNTCGIATLPDFEMMASIGAATCGNAEK